MKRKLPYILTTACLAALLPSQAADTISLSASDDNYVYTGDKNTNYAFDSEKILVKNATSNDRIGFVKFDLSSVIGSLDTNQDAVLSMTFSNASSAGTDDTAEFNFKALSNSSPSNADWSENSVTYNTRPTGTYTDLGTDYNWTYNATNVPHSITFSNIANYIQADNTITFQIFGPQLPDTGNNPYWWSSEATNSAYHPSLVLAVPEPAAASILLGLSSLAFVGLRRRR